MLQDDVALNDVVKKISEQLQQVQSQLAEQQATIKEQQATITEQSRQVDRLTDNVARLEAEHKVLAALQANGTGCCMSALLKPFDIVFLLVNVRKFNAIARSLH